MKVVFVIPNLSAGGAERVISILANSFLKNDVDVDILLLKSREVFYPISNKVNVVYLGGDLLACSKRMACRVMRDYFKKEKQRQQKIVIIPFLDVCLKRVLVATAGLNLSVVASERNDPYQKGTGMLARMKANLPYRMASRCVFQTTGAAEYYCRAVRKKSDVIINPLVMPENVRWRGQKSKSFVSVGRLEPQKNQLMLLEAFKQVHTVHPEYTLEIYGEGSMREVLQARIKEMCLDSSVFLRGHSTNILNVLEESFAFVLSSDYEGLSNALIEALAVGMPVISTDHPCGGARALIQDGVNGVLVPVGEVNAMADAMMRVINVPDFAAQIGEAACRVRTLLSVEQIAQKWMNIISNL